MSLPRVRTKPAAWPRRPAGTGVFRSPWKSSEGGPAAEGAGGGRQARALALLPALWSPRDEPQTKLQISRRVFAQRQRRPPAAPPRGALLGRVFQAGEPARLVPPNLQFTGPSGPQSLGSYPRGPRFPRALETVPRSPWGGGLRASAPSGARSAGRGGAPLVGPGHTQPPPPAEQRGSPRDGWGGRAPSSASDRWAIRHRLRPQNAGLPPRRVSGRWFRRVWVSLLAPTPQAPRVGQTPTLHAAGHRRPLPPRGPWAGRGGRRLRE